MKRNHKEEDIQKAVVKYLQYSFPKCLFTNTLGGVRLVSWKQRSILKQTGYRKGVSDLLIFEPSKYYKALFLEIKNKKGVLSKEQKVFIKEANERGYFAAVGYGLDECINIIEKYFNNGK